MVPYSLNFRCLLEFRIQPGNPDVTLALKARQPEIFPFINQAMSRILSWKKMFKKVLSYTFLSTLSWTPVQLSSQNWTHNCFFIVYLYNKSREINKLLTAGLFLRIRQFLRLGRVMPCSKALITLILDIYYAILEMASNPRNLQLINRK